MSVIADRETFARVPHSGNQQQDPDNDDCGTCRGLHDPVETSRVVARAAGCPALKSYKVCRAADCHSPYADMTPVAHTLGAAQAFIRYTAKQSGPSVSQLCCTSSAGSCGCSTNLAVGPKLAKSQGNWWPRRRSHRQQTQSINIAQIGIRPLIPGRNCL
jgi:hypothetical protein